MSVSKRKIGFVSMPRAEKVAVPHEAFALHKSWPDIKWPWPDPGPSEFPGHPKGIDPKVALAIIGWGAEWMKKNAPTFTIPTVAARGKESVILFAAVWFRRATGGAGRNPIKVVPVKSPTSHHYAFALCTFYYGAPQLYSWPIDGRWTDWPLPERKPDWKPRTPYSSWGRAYQLLCFGRARELMS